MDKIENQNTTQANPSTGDEEMSTVPNNLMESENIENIVSRSIFVTQGIKKQRNLNYMPEYPFQHMKKTFFQLFIFLP